MNSAAKFFLGFALLLLPLQITSESLWLDEGDTAMYALQPDFSSWQTHLKQDLHADAQMPLANFSVWVIARFLGTSEWQLRAVNLLWGAVALLGMYRIGKRLDLAWLPLLLAVQPYFWFYNNEARPYALQIACGSWLCAGFIEFVTSSGKGTSWAWIFSIAMLFLVLATMLAPVPIVACLITGAIIARRSRWGIEKKSLYILFGGAVACLPMAVYYFSTLAKGAKGTQLWHVDLKYFAYVIYELSGMVGLGPSIQHIREIAASTSIRGALIQNFTSFLIPAFYFRLLIVTVATGFRKRTLNSRFAPAMALLGVLSITSAIFIGASLLIQKAFWARHFAAVFPFYIALLGFGLSRVLTHRRLSIRILSCLLLGVLLFSSLRLRFCNQYRKEDYRGAAEFARIALKNDKTVWWIAGGYPAEYYGLDRAIGKLEPGKVFAPQGNIEAGPPADVIILSKPDIHDSGQKVQNFIKQNHYRLVKVLPSFTIWSK